MMVKSGTYNCPCCGLFGFDRFVNENGDHVCDDCGWIEDENLEYMIDIDDSLILRSANG